MLATLIDEPFDQKGWIFEIKWDGYRAIAEVNHLQSCRLYSRNQKSFRETYPSITKTLEQLKYQAIFDGEIVAVDQTGRPSFQLLQTYRQNQSGFLQYVIFDLLEFQQQNMRALPLSTRRERLRSLITDNRILKFSTGIETTGIQYYQAAVAMGLEGIMAKNADSTYREGFRSKQWLKIKAHHTQEAIVCGYTRPTGSREYFGSLVLGAYHEGHLVYIGHAGTGMDSRTLADLYRRMQLIKTSKCPFKHCPRTNQPVTWILPKLVSEVQFQEWTNDGRMRHPVYLRLREDIRPLDVQAIFS